VVLSVDSGCMRCLSPRLWLLWETQDLVVGQIPSSCRLRPLMPRTCVPQVLLKRAALLPELVRTALPFSTTVCGPSQHRRTHRQTRRPSYPPVPEGARVHRSPSDCALLRRSVALPYPKTWAFRGQFRPLKPICWVSSWRHSTIVWLSIECKVKTVDNLWGERVCLVGSRWKACGKPVGGRLKVG
jgi:hypothetical protein